MGKIFGISDNPVSTIESALKGVNHVEPPTAKPIEKFKLPTDIYDVTTKKTLSKNKTNTSNFLRKIVSYFKK